jgi:hypothetical protein
LYLIRLACGDGVRRPLSMREFVEHVREATGIAYDHKTVSLLERDQQGWRLKDVETFAAVDPLQRGTAWLGFGAAPTTAPLLDLDPSRDHRLTAEEAARAEAQVAETARQAKRGSSRKAGGKGKGHGSA